MKHIVSLFSLILLFSISAFGQVPEPIVVGDTGIIVGGAGFLKFAGGDPNKIRKIRVIDERQMASFAWDTTTLRLWQYDRNRTIGKRWKLSQFVQYSNGVPNSGSRDTSYKFVIDTFNRVGYICNQSGCVAIGSGSSVTASSGLTLAAGDVKLGGVLTQTAIITTDATNRLQIRGLQSTTAGDSVVMVDPLTGTLKRKNAADFAGGTTTASNGLTKATDVELGGTLLKSTEIVTAGQSVSITGTGSLNVGTNTDNAGRVNITQTADSVAIDIRTIATGSNKPQLIFRDLVGNEKLRLHYLHDNLFFGSGAGAANAYVAYTNGSSNLGFGNSALQNNIGGYAQTALGHGALYAYTGGTGGVTNSGNTALGFQALFSLPTGVGNTGLGTDAGFSLGAGSNYNTFLGYHLGGAASPITVQDNVIIGAEGFAAFQSGANNNVAIGKNPLYSNTTGNYNVVVGKAAMFANTSGSDNAIVGGRSFEQNTTGFSNVGLGKFSGYANTTGYQNIAIGQEAFFQNTTGIQNVAIGSFALNASTASGLTAVGHGALRKNTTGTGNVGLGWIPAFENTTGSNNLAIGTESSYSNQTGSNNIGLGYRALYNNLSFSNIGIGTRSGISINGYSNTVIGDSVMTSATTANLNVAIGSNAGSTITTGGQNTFLGAKADATTGSGTITNATAIGYRAKVGASNSVVLGGTGADAVNVGINTTTPQYKLDIDASTGAAGNPLRTAGLQQGSFSDSVGTVQAGGLWRRSSMKEVVTWGRGGYVEVTTNYTVLDDDYVLVVSNEASNITIAFPRANAHTKREIVVKRLFKAGGAASTGTITITPTANATSQAGNIENLSGTFSATTTLEAAGSYGSSVRFYSNGTEWIRL